VTDLNLGTSAIGPNGELIVTYGPDSDAEGDSWIYTQLDSDGLGSTPRIPDHNRRSFRDQSESVVIQPNASIAVGSDSAYSLAVQLGAGRDGRAFVIQQLGRLRHCPACEAVHRGPIPGPTFRFGSE